MYISNNMGIQRCFVVQWKSFSQVKMLLWKCWDFLMNKSQSLVWPLFNFTFASSLHKYAAWRTTGKMILISGICRSHIITRALLSWCRINLLLIVRPPDGIAWWINICLYFSSLTTPFILNQISNSIYRNAAPTSKETPSCFTVVCRHSLLNWATGLLLKPNISNCESSIQSTCCHFSASYFLCFPA